MTFHCPRLMLVTDRRRTPVPLADAVARAVAGGVEAVMLREKDLETPALVELGATVRDVCRRAGVAFLVNHDLEAARILAADGVHLGFRSPRPPAVRATLGPRVRIGVSTHDLSELCRAAEEGADYVTFGPVHDTSSKRGLLEPRGIAGLAQAAHAAGDLPVLALGGVTAADAAAVRTAGAAGIAVVGAILGAEDQRAAASEILAAWERGA